MAQRIFGLFMAIATSFVSGCVFGQSQDYARLAHWWSWSLLTW